MAFYWRPLHQVSGNSTIKTIHFEKCSFRFLEHELVVVDGINNIGRFSSSARACNAISAANTFSQPCASWMTLPLEYFQSSSYLALDFFSADVPTIPIRVNARANGNGVWQAVRNRISNPYEKLIMLFPD